MGFCIFLKGSELELNIIRSFIPPKLLIFIFKQNDSKAPDRKILTIQYQEKSQTEHNFYNFLFPVLS